MKTRLALSLVVCSLTAACSSGGNKDNTLAPQALPDTMTARQIEVHGHRGARGAYPENSLPAFDYAMKIGVDVLEFDLGVTKDSILVVTHDPYISPELCTDSKGLPLKEKVPLATLTLTQVQEYQCGMLPHVRFPKQKKMKVKIPTLRQVFELVQNSNHPVSKSVRFNIETKIVPGYAELI